MYAGIACLMMLCLVLPGCAKQQEVVVAPQQQALPLSVAVPVEPPKPTPSYPLLSSEEKAGLLDIPFPLTVVPWKIPSKNTAILIIKYHINSSFSELCDFYRAQMDYWGWEEKNLFLADESCFVFEKPSRQCIVIMRPLLGIPSVSEWEVTLFYGSKKYKERDII
jgi:hypothetical protein